MSVSPAYHELMKLGGNNEELCKALSEWFEKNVTTVSVGTKIPKLVLPSLSKTETDSIVFSRLCDELSVELYENLTRIVEYNNIDDDIQYNLQLMVLRPWGT